MRLSKRRTICSEKKIPPNPIKEDILYFVGDAKKKAFSATGHLQQVIKEANRLEQLVQDKRISNMRDWAKKIIPIYAKAIETLNKIESRPIDVEKGLADCLEFQKFADDHWPENRYIEIPADNENPQTKKLIEAINSHAQQAWEHNADVTGAIHDIRLEYLPTYQH